MGNTEERTNEERFVLDDEDLEQMLVGFFEGNEEKFKEALSIYVGDLFHDLKFIVERPIYYSMFVLSLSMVSPDIDENGRQKAFKTYSQTFSKFLGVSSALSNGGIVYRDGILYTNDQYVEKFGLYEGKFQPTEYYLRVIDNAMDIRSKRNIKRTIKIAKQNEVLSHAFNLDNDNDEEGVFEKMLPNYANKLSYDELRDLERMSDSSLIEQFELMAKELDPVKNLMRMMSK